MRILVSSPPWRCSCIALALFLAGCTDEQRPITAPHAARPASVVSVSEDGVISASMDLPFAPGTGGDWWMWGRLPVHEELRIPAGPHEVEFHVSGGVYFVRKPGIEPWHSSVFEGMYIGPGGVRISPDEWFPALRLQMGYEHAEFEGQGYPPLYAWQAVPYSTAPAHGKVVLTGPGRIIFNRHWNSGWFGYMDSWGFEGKKVWQMWDWVSDQRVTLTIRPLSQEIELTCSPLLVVRGGIVDCEASATTGTLTDIQWSFVDSAGHTIPGPGGAARWGGRLVAGGTMRVSAKLNGHEVSADTPISLTPRTWPTMSVTAIDGGHGDLMNTPSTVEQLAHTHAPERDGPIDVVRIPDGPNRGWSYLNSPIRSARVVVHVSDGFRSGTPLYQMQRSGVDPHTGEAYCSRGQFSNGVQNAARRHEGITPGVTMSHVEVYRHWFRTQNPEKALEAVVGFETDFTPEYTFEEHVDDRFSEHVADPALQDPNQRHTNARPPGLVPFPTVPCKPRLYVTTATTLNLSNDGL